MTLNEKNVSAKVRVCKIGCQCFVALVIMLISFLSPWATFGGFIYYTVEQGGYTWCYRPYTDSDKCEIGARSGTTSVADNQVIYPEPTGHLDIPSHLAGRTVVGISNGALGLHKVTSLTLPSSIEFVGRAFTGCYITSIELPQGLKVADFSSCSNLREVTLPGSLTEFSFNSCSNLESIVIPGTIETIPDGAFECCTSLKKLTISNGVKYLGLDAFTCCFSLREVTIPDSVLELRGPAKNKRIRVSGDEWLSSAGPFGGCKNLQKVVIGKGCTSIGKASFYRCIHLSDVTIEDSVADIGMSAFAQCENIESITLPESVIELGNSAFGNCAQAGLFNFKGAPPSVGENVFLNVKNGAIGTYTVAYASAWEAVIDAKGYWNGLKMRPSYYTVIYDANNGTGQTVTKSGEWDEMRVAGDDVFAWEGHYFIGWAKSPDGEVELTAGAQLPEQTDGDESMTLYAKWGTLAPRGCDWKTGTIELDWQGVAANLNAITYSVYWSESDDSASCVGRADRLVGTKVYSPTGIGAQELMISDNQYLTHGDGMSPIYYHIVGTDGSAACSPRMRNRHGLFVGIGKYVDPNLEELKSCANDAQKWCDMYTANLGASNPLVMTDSECTKEAILGKLGDFATAAQVGDVFLYTHSGHGDYDVLCCYDSRENSASGNVSATEFANALKQFRKGVGVVVVLDACSSGTIPPAMNAPKLMTAKSSPARSTPTSKSFVESVISAIDAANSSPRMMMSAETATSQHSPTDERITSGSEIGWLTAVNETEDSVDGAFSGSCLQTAGWRWGGADRSPFGNGDGYADFGELGRFAKYWCGRMYDQYKMSPQAFSGSILNNVRAGRVTYPNYFHVLSAPQNVSATTDRNDGIEVSWNPVDGADAYWVCFSSGGGELQSKLVEGNSWLIQSADDYSVAFGQPFQIYVKAWNLMDVSERSATVVGVRLAHYTLKFDANGGEGEMPDEEFVVGIEKSLPLNVFDREGYTFGGWGLAPNSVAAAYEDGEAVKDVCKSDGGSDTLYALWAPNAIKLTFNYGPFADKFGPTTFNYTVGTVFHNFPIVTSTAWDVKGWYTRSTGGERYQPGDVLPFTEDGALYLQAEYVGSSGSEPDPEPKLIIPSSPETDFTQDLTIAGIGWHEMSFPVLPEGRGPADVFAPVEDKVGYVTYGSKNWNPETGGTLTALEIGKGYWVQTTADTVSWTVTGRTNPDVEIALKPGWNLIGYPLLEEGEIETVLATALATEKIDFIYSGSRVYPGTLKTMAPGKGYWVYANAAVTIRFDGKK